MARERIHTEDIKESNLPVPSLKEFCGGLYEEGLNYDRLSENELDKVGVITSIVLHDYPQGEGRWVSLHFRESLESLAKTRLKRAEDFIRQIGADLNRLAERLFGDLGDVDMIYGLTQLSASWGGSAIVLLQNNLHQTLKLQETIVIRLPVCRPKQTVKHL